MTEEKTYYESRCQVFESEDIYELEEQLNSFFKGKFIVSSPLYPPSDQNKVWTCVVYYKVSPKEKVKPTEKQIKFLKYLGYKGNPDNLSKQEITKLIDELVRK